LFTESDSCAFAFLVEGIERRQADMRIVIYVRIVSSGLWGWHVPQPTEGLKKARLPVPGFPLPFPPSSQLLHRISPTMHCVDVAIPRGKNGRQSKTGGVARETQRE